MLVRKFAAILLLLGACKSGQELGSPSPDPLALQGHWTLVEAANPELESIRRQARQTPYLSFQGENLNGSTGCNSFGTRFHTREDRLFVAYRQLLITERECPEISDGPFLSALNRASRWKVDRDMLLLLDQDQVILRLQRGHSKALE